MRFLKIGSFFLSLAGLAILAALLYQLPPINERLSWRLDFFRSYLRGVINPAQPLPTPLPPPAVSQNNKNATPTAQPSPTPALTPTAAVTATAQPSPTPLPDAVQLTSPAWEKQDINNCGPATLAMHLRMFGWEGDQFAISDLIKPVREDRNVNVEELVYYVRTRAGWLNAEFRVGGTINMLKQFLAAGLPVMIEESFKFEEAFWPNDDLWAAHYMLLTGYDDASGMFTGQDSYYGPDRKVSYEELDKNWQIFNRVLILLYLPNQEPVVKSILGESWDMDANRQQALDTALAETEADPNDAFAWFNVGSNYVYFGKYSEAGQAYDKARTIGLPQRMLRYQFGPFFAYFHTGRLEELIALTEYALERTPNAEEALLWRGWAYYRQPTPDVNNAIRAWREALASRPNYEDAIHALEFVGSTP